MSTSHWDTLIDNVNPSELGSINLRAAWPASYDKLQLVYNYKTIDFIVTTNVIPGHGSVLQDSVS